MKELKILMIEDDSFIRELYERELKRNGYTVVSCADGESGLERALSEKFDLILLDIMLPKKTGMEVLSALRASPTEQGKTPVFLLTNLGQESIIKDAFKLGADGYLLKARLLPRQIVSEIQAYFIGRGFEKKDFDESKNA